MNRLIDKIILLALSVYILSLNVSGTIFIICIYVAIIFSSLNYYLLTRSHLSLSMKPLDYKEMAAFILETALAMVALFIPELSFIIPLLLYDITKSRNYPALILCIMSLYIYFSLPVSVLIILFSLVSILLSIKSEIISVYIRDIKQIRDDSTEKTNKLRSQNTELMNARDTEIYNAQLSERNRIAREIHDNVGHTLSRAILQMGALLAIHKQEPIHAELESVRQTLDSAMNSIRSSVHDLHDDSIDVSANIIQMAEPLKEKYNVKLDLDIGKDTPRQVKYAIIGITKECISNIIKHSENTEVDIKLIEHPSMYQLIIHDFNPDSENSPGLSDSSGSDSNPASDPGSTSEPADYGMGLENIRGRVEAVNGTLNISNKNGFRVFVTIPR